MRAAVLHRKHQLIIENIPVPVPLKEQVLIKVAFCGVCGTDVHLYNGEEGSVKMTPMTIPGHELSGTIVSTGERVVVDPNYYCNECEECLNHQPHYCLNIKNTGVTVHGGFAEYLVADTSQVHLLPESVSLAAACFLEPLSCCLHGLNKISLHENDHLLIIGGGTIGLLMLQLCQYFKVASITLIEPSVHKRKIAAMLHADEVFDDIAEIRDRQFSKVIECAGLKSTCEQAIRSASHNGHILLFGLTPPDTEITVKPFDFFRKDLSLSSSYINPYTMKEALQIMASGKISIDLLIAAIYPLEKLEEVLKDSELRSKGKILIQP